MTKEMTKKNNRLETTLKWAFGGVIVWNLLPKESKDNIRRWLDQLGNELIAVQRQLAEQDRQRQIREMLSSLSHPLQQPIFPSLVSARPDESNLNPLMLAWAGSPAPVGDNQVKQLLESDAGWRQKIIHPSILIILGNRGSGKSALGYRLLELFRYSLSPYVVGVPVSARNLLPDWISIVPSLEEVPRKAIALVDEAYLPYHARGSMAQESRAMSQLINLSRQREQTIIFVTQEARQVDKNIVSSANAIVFKDLGMLQLEFDRPELNKLTTQAMEALSSHKGDKRWSFVYAPDADFLGLLENELPSFWKPSLSRLFASGVSLSAPRVAKRLTSKEKAQRARELRGQGASYGEIAQTLGVSRGTVLNYIRCYPYRTSQPT